MASAQEDDLYEILGIPRSATKAEIKKAYHKAALSHHPDKVAESERESADVKFKSISQAYEILSDEDTREAYDRHGMAAFEKGGGAGPDGVDLNDILAQMFGGGMGGFPGGASGFPGMGGGMPGMGQESGRKRKGKSEVQDYVVSLEELYTGKTTKFSSTKNVICPTCTGSGGREGKKGKQCGSCDGKGVKVGLRPIGPGLVTQETMPCSTCSGRGSYFSDKDKCRKCKGARVISSRKILELYVPRGAKEGDKIVLPGEADQVPGQEPGDIVFNIVEKSHDTFDRAGADLSATIDVGLVEALTGVRRVVVRHMDGRGIRIDTLGSGKVLRPDDILLVKGEGMPVKKSDGKGDLYLAVNIKFPEDGWLKDEAAVRKVREALPTVEKSDLDAGKDAVVDEVDFEVVEDLAAFGAGSGDPRGGAEWEDENEDEDVGDGQPQCQQQ